MRQSRRGDQVATRGGWGEPEPVAVFAGGSTRGRGFARLVLPGSGVTTHKIVAGFGSGESQNGDETNGVVCF